MALRHLTDEELQDYLDGNFSSENSFPGEHLDKCKLCQETLKEYRRLYAGLKNYQGFELSPDFAESVLSELQGESMVKSQKRCAGLFWISVGLILGVCTTVYVVIRTKADQEIAGIVTKQLELFSASLDSLARFMGNLNIDFGLLFFSGLTLLVIGLADYAISHKGEQSIPFLNNI